MAPRSTSLLAGPLHISYPIKAPPAHALQLQSEIYCPGASLSQQDTEGMEKQKEKREGEETAEKTATIVHEKWT